VIQFDELSKAAKPIGEDIAFGLNKANDEAANLGLTLRMEVIELLKNTKAEIEAIYAAFVSLDGPLKKISGYANSILLAIRARSSQVATSS
jgi:hypothetical protein